MSQIRVYFSAVKTANAELKKALNRLDALTDDLELLRKRLDPQILTRHQIDAGLISCRTSASAAYTKMKKLYSLCVRRAMIPQCGESVLAVLCDGMGGLQKGELASAYAVQTFGAWFDQNINRLSELCAGNFEQVRQQWTALILSLHSRIRTHSQGHGIQMGTTLTAILTYDGRYLTVNVGDSRIYERKYALKQLTEDQSLVAREIALGRITKDQARHHPQRNVLLQCLGVGNSVTPVFTVGTVVGNGLYLLCSDGFVQEVSETEMEVSLDPMVLMTKELLTQRLAELTAVCKQRGEKDNITAILCRTVESQYTPPPSALKRTLQKLHIKKGPDTNHQAILLETAQVVHIEETI